MIDLHGQISLGFVKKRRFTGSYQGMRYLLQKKETEKADGEGEPRTETVLEAIVWPEPMSFEATEEEAKVRRDFPFHKDGLWEATEWLNQMYEERYR